MPFPSSPLNFFELFGLSPSLEIKEEELRFKFYDLSQKAHPDAHSQADAFNQLQAAKWSTFINKAFQTLKDQNLRLDYILQTASKTSFPASRPPTHLAEQYFELQETLLEGPNPEATARFLSLLALEEAQMESELKQISLEWGTSNSKEVLYPRIKRYIDTQKYLASLRADLNKNRGVL